MRAPTWVAMLGVGALALPACTIGNSASSSANLTVADTMAVADGVSSIVVTVTGDADSRITLVVDGDGAEFVDADPGATPTEKSVYLLDDGTATAEMVSTVDGKILVAVKGERTRTTVPVDFLPLRFAAGTARPSGFTPGFTMHDVCFAVNSAAGFLMASRLEGIGTFPADGRAVEDEMPKGAGCPTEAADEIGWKGWVEFAWGSATGIGAVTLGYYGAAVDPVGGGDLGEGLDAGSGDEADAGEADASWDKRSKAAMLLASETLDLAGAAFPGYEVEAGEPEIDQFVSVELALSYQDQGSLVGGAAGGVHLGDIHTVPELDFAGSSSSNDLDDVRTGSDGHATLYFDYEDAGPGSYALYVTPAGGATVHVADLVVEKL